MMYFGTARKKKNHNTFNLLRIENLITHTNSKQTRTHIQYINTNDVSHSRTGLCIRTNVRAKYRSTFHCLVMFSFPAIWAQSLPPSKGANDDSWLGEVPSSNCMVSNPHVARSTHNALGHRHQVAIHQITFLNLEASISCETATLDVNLTSAQFDRSAEKARRESRCEVCTRMTGYQKWFLGWTTLNAIIQ